MLEFIGRQTSPRQQSVNTGFHVAALEENRPLCKSVGTHLKSLMNLERTNWADRRVQNLLNPLAQNISHQLAEGTIGSARVVMRKK